MSRNVVQLADGISMDKQKALESALAQIERSFGKGSIMKLGQRDAAMEIEAIPTGSLGLDIALGVGGLPRGRIVEIYGPESSGKTTLALHSIAEEQKLGGVCAFIDPDPACRRQRAACRRHLRLHRRRTRARPGLCAQAGRRCG